MEQKIVKKRVLLTKQTVEFESDRLKNIRKEAANWLYTSRRKGSSRTIGLDLLSFERALQINKKNKEALFNIGYTYYYNQHLDSLNKALKYMDQYIRYYPDDPIGYLCKAQLLIGLKKSKDAFQLVKKAIELVYDNYGQIKNEFCEIDTIFLELNSIYYDGRKVLDNTTKGNKYWEDYTKSGEKTTASCKESVY